jgi:hypothetical protein
MHPDRSCNDWVTPANAMLEKLHKETPMMIAWLPAIARLIAVPIGRDAARGPTQ